MQDGHNYVGPVIPVIPVIPVFGQAFSRAESHRPNVAPFCHLAGLVHC
jgi:hypothetical protein